jgi:hypothetical protein
MTIYAHFVKFQVISQQIWYNWRRKHSCLPRIVAKRNKLGEMIELVSEWNILLLFVVYLTTVFQYLKLYGVEETVMRKWWIGYYLEGSGRALILRYYPGSHLEGPRKTTKNVIQDIRSPGPGLNPRPLEWSTKQECWPLFQDVQWEANTANPVILVIKQQK